MSGAPAAVGIVMPHDRPSAGWRSALEALVGARHVSDDPAELEVYGRDWTRAVAPAAGLLVRPGSAVEVAAVLGWCQREHVPVVPSGGRTGLAGGAVAAAGELVLSLERLRAIGPLDPIGRTIRVEAGVINQALQDHLAQLAGQVGPASALPPGAGSAETLCWPVTLASRGSCQIGGNLATNAGGLRVLRYGHARHWALGLQVALADGTLTELGGACVKDNSGPDLKQLLIGSEGILGVITAATLQLAPAPADAEVLWLALADLDAAGELLRRCRAAPGLALGACELIARPCLDAVLARRGWPEPCAARADWYLLVELEAVGHPAAGAGPGEALEGLVARLLGSGLVLDGVRSSSAAQAQRLWAYREDISETLQERPHLHKNDLAVPVAALPAFAAQVRDLLAARYGELQVYLFGHSGDGNLHVNLAAGAEFERARFAQRCRAADGELYELVALHGGSVAAEHGIGLLKRHALPYSKSAGAIAALAAVKRALDPHGILNPGKVL